MTDERVNELTAILARCRKKADGVPVATAEEILAELLRLRTTEQARIARRDHDADAYDGLRRAENGYPRRS